MPADSRNPRAAALALSECVLFFSHFFILMSLADARCHVRRRVPGPSTVSELQQARTHAHTRARSHARSDARSHARSRARAQVYGQHEGLSTCPYNLSKHMSMHMPMHMSHGAGSPMSVHLSVHMCCVHRRHRRRICFQQIFGACRRRAPRARSNRRVASKGSR